MYPNHCKRAKPLHVFLHMLHLLGHMVKPLRHAVATSLTLGRPGVQQVLPGLQSHLHQADKAAAVHEDGDLANFDCHKNISPHVFLRSIMPPSTASCKDDLPLWILWLSKVGCACFCALHHLWLQSASGSAFWRRLRPASSNNMAAK